MKTSNVLNLASFVSMADNGPFMRAQIFSLTGQGNLRVTCNWLYSALNIDPRDASNFLWEFSKVGEKTIAISPVDSCISKKTYASARDDNNYFMQVQAPNSADWITAVGRDEILEFSLLDLNIATFKGFNGSYLELDAGETSHDKHSGYRLRSVGTVPRDSSQWYLKIERSMQSNLRLMESDYTSESIQAQLLKAGIKLDKEVVEKLVRQLNN